MWAGRDEDRGCVTGLKDLFVEDVTTGTTEDGLSYVLQPLCMCIVVVAEEMQTEQLVKTHLFTTTVFLWSVFGDGHTELCTQL